MITKDCRWVLADGSYCCAPVKWKMAEDDFGNRYRKYYTFCDKHQEQLKHLPDYEGEEEWE